MSRAGRRQMGRGSCRGNRHLRKRLFDTDPRCHWCGRETRWTHHPAGGRQADDEATLDHFGERRYGAVVLACYGCNQYRSRLEQARWANRGIGRAPLPSVEKLIAESRAWLDRAAA